MNKPPYKILKEILCFMSTLLLWPRFGIGSFLFLDWALISDDKSWSLLSFSFNSIYFHVYWLAYRLWHMLICLNVLLFLIWDLMMSAMQFEFMIAHNFMKTHGTFRHSTWIRNLLSQHVTISMCMHTRFHMINTLHWLPWMQFNYFIAITKFVFEFAIFWHFRQNLSSNA